MAARGGVSDSSKQLDEYVLIMTRDTAIANTAVLGPQWLARLEGTVKITSRHDSGTDIFLAPEGGSGSAMARPTLP